jgi:DNA sulfur modification protein DndD
MILERLLLENFRQFKGRQEIIFSDLRSQNVTVVHAENGFGKTALLKALLWALYGKEGLKEDFEKPDSIIHEGLVHRAKELNSVSASVELTFKHDGERYILTRRLSLSQQRFDASKTDIALEVMRDGQTFALDRPQQRIQSIVPDGISGFLFFNGERINYLAEERNSAQVTEAIQQMLGLKLLKTTIEDLRHQNVRGKLRAEQKEATSDEKRVLIDRLAELESEVKENEESRNQVFSNLKALAAEIEAVDAKLVANQKAHELQTRRIRLGSELQELSGRRDEVSRRLTRLVSEDGYSLFAYDLISRGREVVSQLRSEGKIPARVLNTFLEELLEAGKCICSRHLAEGSSERAAVQGLLTIAGDQAFNNAVGALDHAIGLIEGVAAQTKEQLRQLHVERLGLLRDIRDRDEEIEEIHQLLGGKDDEEVQHLEDQRNKLQLERDEQNAKLGRVEGQIESAKEEIGRIGIQIRQIEDKQEAAACAQRRVDAVEDCVGILEMILKAETEDLRPLLNDEIDRHFRNIMTKDYWAELTENYTLRIRKRIAGVAEGDGEAEIDAALSTGERTVTSLVFIASLVALAKRRSEIPTILKDVSGSAYPVVIDSPFGSLSIFRDGVARNIPELAPQVLLLVSPEQYNGQVERALSETGRVGKRYYLAYHGPSIPERASPKLEIHGHEIQQYFAEEGDEYTEIKELEL